MKKLIVLAVCGAVHIVLSGAVAKINPPSGKIKAQWFEEFVPMVDGVRLYTIGVAPANVEKCPIVVIRMQYAPGTRKLLRYRFADHDFRLEKGDRLRVDVAGASAHFAPHPNVAGSAFKAKTPQVAHNQVFAEESKLIMFAR